MPLKLANIGCGTTIHPTWENYDLVPSSPGVTRINLLQGLPFADAVYDGIYCSHVLEHLPRQRVIGVLREFRRALRPDGILRVVVPDLEVIAELYLKELRAALGGDQSAADRHEWMCMELLDQMTRSFSGGFMGRLLSSRPLNSRGFVQGRIGQEGRVWLESVDPSTALDPNLVYDVPDTTEKAETKFRSSGELHRWMYDRLSLGRLLREAGFARIKVCGPDESAIHGFAGFGLDTDEKGAVRKPDSLFMEATAIAAGDKSNQSGRE
ncbi:MAG: methyltransferase domain-containing protein [Chthoniobacterales bacterium]|nr:methyltransferase domain-containing protein [Chthoniobacterales bacterium]